MIISCRDASASFSRRLGPSVVASTPVRFANSAAVGHGQTHVPATSAAAKPTVPDKIALDPERLQRQLELRSSADILRRVFLGPLAIQRSRTINYRMRKNQLDPKPSEAYLAEKYGPIYMKRVRLENDEGDQSAVVSMDLLRFQIKACRAPEDLLRVVTVACQDPTAVHMLASSQLQHIMAVILGRLDKDRALRTLGVIQSRFAEKGLSVDPSLAYVAMRTAAAQGHWTALRAWLRTWRDQLASANAQMPKQTFYEILSALKAAVNAKPLSPSERKAVRAIMQYSYDDELRERGPYHLHIHMPSHDPQALIGWIDILHAAGLNDAIGQEVHHFVGDEWWLDLSGKPKTLRRDIANVYYTLISALVAIGHQKQAQRLFTRVAHNPDTPPDNRLWTLALSGALGNLRILPEQRANAESRLASILARRLAAIEKRLGIRWAPPLASTTPNTSGTAHGHHTYVPDGALAKTLELLADPRFKEFPDLATHRFWRDTRFDRDQRAALATHKKQVREQAREAEDRVSFSVPRLSSRRPGGTARTARRPGIVGSVSAFSGRGKERGSRWTKSRKREMRASRTELLDGEQTSGEDEQARARLSQGTRASTES